jgi:hypothetical protein
MAKILFEHFDMWLCSSFVYFYLLHGYCKRGKARRDAASNMNMHDRWLHNNYDDEIKLRYVTKSQLQRTRLRGNQIEIFMIKRCCERLTNCSYLYFEVRSLNVWNYAICAEIKPTNWQFNSETGL